MLSCFIIFIIILTGTLNAQDEDKSVVIIGAGLSGYSAARKLMENGFNDIKILEVLNRIGGRIYSIPFADGWVDSGAQWCHGETGNIIYQMASPSFSFGSTPFETIDPYFRFSDGTLPPQKHYSKLYTLGSNIMDELDEIEDPQGSIGVNFLSKFDEALSNEEYQGISDETINYIKEEWRKNVNGFFGTNSWHEISTKRNKAQEKTGGDQHRTWKKQGFKTIFDYITKKLPNPSQYLNIDSKVQFNKKVTNVQYNINDESSKATLSCVDGSTFTAKHVIFTPSIGVLKKHHQSLFTPSLPTNKIGAINSIGFGSVAKFFMEFETSFWVTPGKPFLQFTFMWLEGDKNALKGTDREWMLDIVGIYGVESFPNLLEVFLAGNGVYAFELATNEKVLSDVKWLVEKFVPDLNPMPSPKAVHKTKWLTDENFLGGYSYPSMNEENNNVGIRDMKQTIKTISGMPVLLFAGEATSIEYPSMAHGAIESGFRAADEIIDYYKP